MLIHLIEIAAVVAGLGYAAPQILRVLRARTTAGVSLLAWQITAATTGAWMVHGGLVHAPAIMASNASGVLAGAWIVWLIRRERRLSVGRCLRLPVLLFAACVVVRLVAGPALFGAFVVVPQVLSMSGQAFELIRARDLRGVSPVFLWYGVGLQALWLAYGLLKPDVAIVIAAVATGTVCVFNVVWYLLRGWGVVAAHPRFGRRSVVEELDPEPPVAAEVDPVG